MKYDILTYQTSQGKIVEFHIPQELDISEFKVIVKRIAKSIGYKDDSITKTFGGDDDGVKEKELLLE